MIKFVRTNLFPALLAILMFFVIVPFFESVHRIYDQQTPAITWHSGRAISGVVKPGYNLQIIYNATINKTCPSDIRSFIIGPDGSAAVRMPIVAGGYTQPSTGPRDIKVSIKIPEHSDQGLSDFVTGQYTYRTMVTRYCPGGIEQDTNVPDIKFFMEVK